MFVEPRLPIIAPDQLDDRQKPLYEDMKTGISADFSLFQTVADNGALIGPWNAWLHEPEIGGAIWNLTKVMTAQATLDDQVRQVVILVVGAHFDAAYELYAHIAVAEHQGMSEEQLATLCTGQKPADLSADQSIGYDVAFALVNGGVLARPAWDLAVKRLGQRGAAELVYLVGLYCMVSTTLNAFAIQVPDPDET